MFSAAFQKLLGFTGGSGSYLCTSPELSSLCFLPAPGGDPEGPHIAQAAARGPGCFYTGLGQEAPGGEAIKMFYVGIGWFLCNKTRSH